MVFVCLGSSSAHRDRRFRACENQSVASKKQPLRKQDSIVIVQMNEVTAVVCQVLDELKEKQEMTREVLIDVARTSLRTKVHQELADLLTEVHFAR